MRRTLTLALIALLTAAGLLATSLPAQASAPTARPAARAALGLGYTQVDLDPAVYALVAGAGITPAPIGGATAFTEKGTLAARFPISSVGLLSLSIRHRGGLQLTAGSASLSLSRFDIDVLRGKVSAVVVADGTTVGRVDVFNLVGSRRLDLGLLGLTLTATAASALDSTFGVTAFTAGATFGYATPVPFAPLGRAALRTGVARLSR